jgi:hypothetical protein
LLPGEPIQDFRHANAPIAPVTVPRFRSSFRRHNLSQPAKFGQLQHEIQSASAK